MPDETVTRERRKKIKLGVCVPLRFAPVTAAIPIHPHAVQKKKRAHTHAVCLDFYTKAVKSPDGVNLD